MKTVKIILQVLGILLLIPAVAMATLRFDNRNADGPSILFPGGEMTSGELYTGSEPDWSFTDTIPTIELQLNDPMASRLIYILESEGKIYVISGYMSSFLGRLWKEWAIEADAGNDQGVLRVNGIRYPRRLVRIEQGEALNGVAAKLLTKYFGVSSPAPPAAIAGTRANIEAGNSWVFELQPR
ncbi:MAG: hypothetical protein QGF90_02035 [Gammaproteobacteria bacterium]|jgi:hypothetical protein|nr:hypothetical protein [Gammaproteobacteria bacterium]